MFGNDLLIRDDREACFEAASLADLNDTLR